MCEFVLWKSKVLFNGQEKPIFWYFFRIYFLIEGWDDWVKFEFDYEWRIWVRLLFLQGELNEYVNEFDIANGYVYSKWKKNWVRKERFEICFNKYIEEKWVLGDSLGERYEFEGINNSSFRNWRRRLDN